MAHRVEPVIVARGLERDDGRDTTSALYDVPLVPSKRAPPGCALSAVRTILATWVRLNLSKDDAARRILTSIYCEVRHSAP